MKCGLLSVSKSPCKQVDCSSQQEALYESLWSPEGCCGTACRARILSVFKCYSLEEN